MRKLEASYLGLVDEISLCDPFGEHFTKFVWQRVSFRRVSTARPRPLLGSCVQSSMFQVKETDTKRLRNERRPGRTGRLARK